jgi:hypothetical protein
MLVTRRRKAKSARALNAIVMDWAPCAVGFGPALVVVV